MNSGGKPLRRPRVSGRAAPAGAVAFGVKHTEGVSVDVLFRGRAEPEAVPGAGTRWPLDEGTVLRFSMSRASSEVNDNKVRSGIPGTGPPRGRTSLPNVGFGVCRSPSASTQREGSPSTKPGCSSPASVSAEAPRPGIHPDPLSAGSRGGDGDGKPGFAGSGGFAPARPGRALGRRRLCARRDLPGRGRGSGRSGGKEQPQQGTPASPTPRQIHGSGGSRAR